MAFNLLQGESLPVDPVHGQSYRWDPETRELKLPDTAEFEGVNVKPVIVP